MSHAFTGKVAYHNVRLLDPASGLDALCIDGGVLTEGEEIVAFGPGIFRDGFPEGASVVDGQGLCLAPGLVDMRVQLREPGEEYKETLKSGCTAAVSGGITSMVCLPNTTPVMDDPATLEYVARRARHLGLTKVYPYAAATEGLQGHMMTEYGILKEAGALAVTDGLKAIADAKTMVNVLKYAANYGLPVIQHPEEPSLATGGMMNAGETAIRLGLNGIPREAEIIMLERDMRLVEMTGAAYHAAHISTAESVAIIRAAKAKGLPVTCDTAPPYFALNELTIGDYRTFAKLSPPLRSESDREAIVDGLKDGTIDIIASDHAPQDAEDKRQPFGIAEPGGCGLETLLPVTLNLVHTGNISLLEAIRALTLNPARFLGLDAGYLREGAPADLILFHAEEGWRIDADKLKSKSKNTPFDGMPVQGRVYRTIIDGRCVYKHPNAF
jgi:dihydroorotase